MKKIKPEGNITCPKCGKEKIKIKQYKAKAGITADLLPFDGNSKFYKAVCKAAGCDYERIFKGLD